MNETSMQPASEYYSQAEPNQLSDQPIDEPGSPYSDYNYTIAYESDEDGNPVPEGGNTAIFAIHPHGLTEPVYVTKPEEDATFTVTVLAGKGRFVRATQAGEVEVVPLEVGSTVVVRPGDAYSYRNDDDTQTLVLHDVALPAFRAGDDLDLRASTVPEQKPTPEPGFSIAAVKTAEGVKQVSLPNRFWELVSGLETNPYNRPLEYFDAQVQFAQKWSAITGEAFPKVLMQKTALYRRLTQERPPKEVAEQWARLVGEAGADHQQIAAHLYDVYKDQPDSVYTQPEHPHAFGYDYYDDQHKVKIHFTSPVRGASSFASENMSVLRDEFKRMLQDAAAQHPDATTLVTGSWLRSTDAYQSFSPPNIAAQESLMSPDMSFAGDSLWGQFVSKTGNINRVVYDKFVDTVGKAETVEDLLAAFPYQVMKAEDPIDKYYEYYGVKAA